MRASTERILTSHTGSLHRPPEFEQAAIRHFESRDGDEGDWGELVRSNVEDVVRRQRALGIDVVNDGEYSKTNWFAFAEERLTGFSEETALPPRFKEGRALGAPADVAAFPQFYADAAELDGVSLWRRHSESFFPGGSFTAPRCIGPVTYVGHDAAARDIDNLTAALRVAGVEHADAFIGVPGPASFAALHPNEHYDSEPAYMLALADAIGEECRLIASAGLNVQIDDPSLPSGGAGELGELIVAATNRALRSIPEEQVRYHICWGSWNGPHGSDVPLAEVIDLLYAVGARTYSIEAANARHAHEWRVFAEHPLPDGKMLMPGLVTHATNVVEHPELVADNIVRFAGIVGRENVIAGTDCGFRARSHPEIAWAKLRALSDGARLASETLWRR